VTKGKLPRPHGHPSNDLHSTAHALPPPSKRSTLRCLTLVASSLPFMCTFVALVLQNPSCRNPRPWPPHHHQNHCVQLSCCLHHMRPLPLRLLLRLPRATRREEWGATEVIRPPKLCCPPSLHHRPPCRLRH
jgi:hypothetical protein